MGATRRGLLLGTGALALLPVSAFVLGRATLGEKLIPLGVLLLSALRPGYAWIALAGLAPLGGVISSWLGVPGSLAEPLVLAFLAGWLLREGTQQGQWPPRAKPLVTPATLFGLTVAASICVQVAVRQLYVDFWPSYLRSVVTFLARDYFAQPRFLPIAPGLQLLEGVGLFVATLVLIERNGRLRVAGLATLAGAAAVMGLVNIEHFIRASAAGGDLFTAIYTNITAPTARVSRGIADFNAAGSFFALGLFVAGGLAWHKTLRPFAVAAGLCMFLGLWLAGSRTAMLAIPAIVLGGTLLQARRRGWASMRVLTASGLVLLALAAVYWTFSLTRPDRAATTAVDARLELSATALRMYADHPVFGAGVGRFYEISEAYMAPRWRTMIMRENAHNNFLQILAELGLPGLGFFVWLLVAVAVRIRSSRDRWAPPVVGAVMGLVAFLVTCLAGHPFLTLEASLAFWLVLGVAAGAPPEDAAAVRTDRAGLRRVVAVMLGALVLASVPVRAAREMARAELSDAGIGVSNSRADPSGVRYRWMGRTARIYVPAGTGQAAIPLRLSRGVGSVTASFDGREAGRLLVSADEWREMRLTLPAGSPKYVAVDLRLGVVQPPVSQAADPGESVRVMVGMARVIR